MHLKNWSASVRAAGWNSRWPTAARMPAICASPSYVTRVPPFGPSASVIRPEPLMRLPAPEPSTESR